MGLKISDLGELSWGGTNNASETYFPIVYNNGQSLVNRKLALSSIWDIIEQRVKDTYNSYKSEYYFGGEGSSSGGGSGSGSIDPAALQQAISSNQTVQSAQRDATLALNGVESNSAKINDIYTKKFYIKVLDPAGTVNALYSYSPDDGLQALNTTTQTPSGKTIEVVSGYRATAKYKYNFTLSASATYTEGDEYSVQIGSMVLSTPPDQQTTYTGDTRSIDDHITMEIRVTPSWAGGTTTQTISRLVDTNNNNYATGTYDLRTIVPGNGSSNCLNDQDKSIFIEVQFGSFYYPITISTPGVVTSSSQIGDIV